MKTKRQVKQIKNKKNEQGAALVTVLMVTFILLVACVGLLLESSMNSANVTDSLAEEQAYVAAESGIQTALNVLRGNVAPNPLLDSSTSSKDIANTINFNKALNLSTSNLEGDTSTDARLSRWINYNYTPTSVANPDRITMGSNYTPATGMAFKISLSDPDYTEDYIAFSTTGRIDGGTNFKIFGSGLNTVVITFNPKSVAKLSMKTGLVDSDIGSFTITTIGNGATIPEDIRFEIIYTMSIPYEAVRVMRGYIKAGTVTQTSPPTIYYDSPTYLLLGSTISLTGGTAMINPNGYKVIAPSSNTTLPVSCSITPAEPYRILIHSTGYGPRGAKKQLEAIVQKNFLNGMEAPATLTLVGSSSGFVFDAGTSQNVTYSGDDVVSSVIIPSIGTDNANNLSAVQAEFLAKGRKADIYGTPSDVTVELPPWLQSSASLDTTIQSLRNVAKSSGRYYANGEAPPNLGDYANSRGITFIEGDYSMSEKLGGGILVCTGKLTLNGAFSFSGLIIVTGAGGLDRQGGGNGEIEGNVVVAPYNQNNVAAGFLSPKYDMSGGGDSVVRYNSSSVANGLTAVSNFVLGVVEK